MKITKSEYIVGAVKKSQYPANTGPLFVFFGRSNVGKSSFINALCNRKNLAYTSSKPGKTQVLNFFKINDSFSFVDVPGYGYASRAKSERLDFGNMIEGFLDNNQLLKYVFLIVDFRHAPTEDDCLMINYLRSLNMNIAVVATKQDKVGKSLILKNKKIIKEKLELTCEPLFVVSSETKNGLEDVLSFMESLLG